MPIYEYKCEKGHTFDAMQRMTEDALTKCIECGAPAQRLFSAPAVHFKGSGFYNTDYGKRNAKPSSENGSSSESKSGDSGESKKSESKGSDSKSSSPKSSD